MLALSGPRRKRLGDFLGGTVVVDASPDPGPPPPSPLTVVYPTAWTGAALALLFAVGNAGDAYVSRMESICKERLASARSSAYPLELEPRLPVDLLLLAAMRSVEPPPERLAAHREILALQAQVIAEAHAVTMRARAEAPSPVSLAPLLEASGRLERRFEQLGLDACAP